ncbi:MAG: hypothetical protein ACE5PM_04470 [Candidatus Hydrothermarchaeales archaeon]
MAYENLEAFEKELEDEGFFKKQVQKTLEALRIIYIGQENIGTIGIPHGDVDAAYEREIEYLIENGLVYTVPHTGVWDFGYRCTDDGNAIGAEIVQRTLEENEGDIKKFLDKFPKKILSYWLANGFEVTKSGHLTSRTAYLSFAYIINKVLEAVDIFNLCEVARKGLISLDVGVKSYDGQITVLAPEFADFIREYTVEIGEETNEYGIYKTLVDFMDRRGFSSRTDLFDRLEQNGYSEDQLEELINDAAELELTTRYIRSEVLLEEDEELDEEDVDDIPPFEVMDREGFVGYLKEIFIEPMKESLRGVEAPSG